MGKVGVTPEVIVNVGIEEGLATVGKGTPLSFDAGHLLVGLANDRRLT